MRCGLSDMRHVLLMFAARMHASAFVWAPNENSNAYLLFRKSITKIKSVLKFQNNSVLTRYTYWQCVVVTSNALSCLMLRMMRDQLNKNIISSDFESRKSAKTHLKPAKQTRCTRKNALNRTILGSIHEIPGICSFQFDVGNLLVQKHESSANCGESRVKSRLQQQNVATNKSSYLIKFFQRTNSFAIF